MDSTHNSCDELLVSSTLLYCYHLQYLNTLFASESHHNDQRWKQSKPLVIYYSLVTTRRITKRLIAMQWCNLLKMVSLLWKMNIRYQNSKMDIRSGYLHFYLSMVKNKFIVSNNLLSTRMSASQATSGVFLLTYDFYAYLSLQTHIYLHVYYIATKIPQETITILY